MSGDGAALVGRERHLGELRLLIDGARAGRGGVVVLSGEAGAGKTRLAEEAVGLALAADMHVAWATGWGSSAGPLSTWCDLVAGVDADAAVRAAALPATTEVDPDAARAVLLRSLVAELHRDLGSRVALLVVDDGQWCDPLSLLALEALVASLRSAPVGVLVTLRDDGEHPLARFEGLTRRGRHLIVPPLTEDELGALALQLTGRTLSQQALARLRDRSAGNALFATELLTGDDDGRERKGTSTASAVFIERLTDLSAECRRVLDPASVIGRRFRLDVVAETLGLTEEEVLAALGEAHAARLVRESGIGAYEFAHPLMAEECYASVGLPRRVRLHRDVGEALERLRARGLAVPASELAHHFGVAASAGAAAKAVEHAAAAGRESMDQLAYEDAARNFSGALAALDLCPVDPATRVDLSLELGDALAASGDLPSARRAYEDGARLAREHGWHPRLARAALGVGSGPGGFEVPAFDREQIALLEEAVSVTEGAQHAQVLARLSVALSMDADAERRLRLCEEAVAAAHESGDPLTLGYALASLSDVVAGPADAQRRLDVSAEILVCASEAHDTRLELLGRRLRVVALLEMGAIAAVDEEIAAFAAQADRLGQVVYSWYVPLWRGLRAVMEGRVDDARELRRIATRLGEAAHSDNAAMLTGSQEAMLQCELGDATAIEFFERVIARWPGIAVMARPGLAYCYAAAGDNAQASEVLDVVTLSDYTVEALGSEWLSSAVMLSYAAALTATTPLASQLYDMLEPFRARHAIDGIGCYDLGSVERPLGMLAGAIGERTRAVEHFDAALREHRRVGAGLLVAGTLRDAAHALEDAAMLAEANKWYAKLGLATAKPIEVPKAAVNVFRRDGDVWHVGFNGTSTRVRDTKGARDIAYLLMRPMEDIHVLDMVATGPTVRSDAIGDSLDEVARADYRARLIEIEADLSDADEQADLGRSEQLHLEREALIAELSRAYGLGGRARPRGASAERARSAVTQRIRDALARIEALDPGLGAHLRRSIRTGIFCSYRPDPPVTWEL